MRKGDPDHERHADPAADASPGRHRPSIRSPRSPAHPAGIALGADANLWITELTASKIAQLNSRGQVSEAVTPTRNAGPNGIAAGPGPNLNMWFTETNIAKVAQITLTGPPYTEYTLPDKAARPAGLALGSDGNMWVCDIGTNSIWKVQQIRKKPHVLFTQYPLTGNAQPAGITNGPDGAIWFTEPGTNSIGRLPVTGSVHRHRVSRADEERSIRKASRPAPTTRSGSPSARA